jgi:FkbM family methyltransferase
LEKVFISQEYEIPYAVAPRVIVDGGANIGMATLYFGVQFPSARIVAIEPEQSNFVLLERNCGYLKNVTLIKGALWPEAGQLAILDGSVDKWAFRVTNQVACDLPGAAIPAVTIPEILQRFNVPRIDILKLDIEGSECELFADRAEQWLDRIGMIIIELHDRFRPGCAQSFYSALNGRKFVQEIRGENIFVKLEK